MKNSKAIWMLLLIGSLLLSACTIEINTTVNADGSGSLGMTYKLTPSDLETFESMGMPATEICTSLSEEADEDMTFTQEEHGDEIWCIASQSFATLDELKSAMQGDGFDINTLQISDGRFSFEANADMTGQDTGGMDFGMIDIQYTVTAPGTVTDHNGDEINGNAVTWNLALGSSQMMYLESKVGGGGSTSFSDFPWWALLMLCCCCVVMVILVIAVGLIIWRMNQGVKAGEPIPSADPDILVGDPRKLAEGDDFNKPGGNIGS